MRSVYAPEAKRQKTADERKADKEQKLERKLEKQAMIASTDPTAEWSLGTVSRPPSPATHAVHFVTNVLSCIKIMQ